MMPMGLSEILAASVGAFATGLFGILDRRGERVRKRTALTSEIAAHAKFLTKLVRDQGYAEDANKIAEAALSPNYDGTLLFVIPTHDYLHGLAAASHRAGELNPSVAAQLIEFHHRCVLFVDTTHPSEEYLLKSSLEDKKSHAIETAKNIKLLLKLGEDLSQLP